MDNESNRHRPAGRQPRPGGYSKGNSPHPADQGGKPFVDIIDSFRQDSHGTGGTGEADGVLKVHTVRKEPAKRQAPKTLWGLLIFQGPVEEGDYLGSGAGTHGSEGGGAGTGGDTVLHGPQDGIVVVESSGNEFSPPRISSWPGLPLRRAGSADGRHPWQRSPLAGCVPLR